MARLPKWLRIGRARTTSRTVTVTIIADTSQFTAAMRNATQAIEQLAASARRYAYADQIHHLAHQLQLIKVRLDAKLYIRGALDPTYATPDARDAYVKELARWPRPFAKVAIGAFLRGWLETHDQPHELYVRHTMWGDTRIEVCCP